MIFKRVLFLYPSFLVINLLCVLAGRTAHFTFGGFRYSLKDDKCSNDCLNLMESLTKIYLPKSNFQEILASADLPEELTTVCHKVYTPNTECFDKCPMNNTALSERLLLQHRCMDSYLGFVNYMPCISKVLQTYQEQCTFCFDNNLHYSGSVGDDVVTTIKYCTEGTCFLKCISPYMTDICGENAVIFYKHVYSYLMEMYDQSAMVVRGKQNDWPKECRSLKKAMNLKN